MTAMDLCFQLHIKNMKDFFDFDFVFWRKKKNHAIPLYSPLNTQKLGHCCFTVSLFGNGKSKMPK